MKAVVFTGAGAGKADGVPLQTELFQQFFSSVAILTSRAKLAGDVAGLFKAVFRVDPRQVPGASLPTFEEALGVLDLAIAREEAIIGVGGEHYERDVHHLRRQLVLALAATIARTSVSPASHHSRLIASLRETALLDGITFVTTNYDTLLDDAIELEAVRTPRGTGSLIDYGFGSLIQRDAGKYAERRTFQCYKIHGSLNWLYCAACDALHITASDGVMRLVDEPHAARCPICETLRTSIIVPPSYYKDMSNMYLSIVWNNAFRALRTADQLVFCGYSFPDADMHIKYLVKRAQLNRDPASQPLRVLLVNSHPGKTPDAIANEYHRFRRFLGATELDDTGLSFEDFASDPASVLRKRS